MTMTTLEAARDETREVEVRDARLSQTANSAVARELTDELGSAAPAAVVIRPSGRQRWLDLSGGRLGLAITLGVALTVGALLVLYGGSWWWLLVPVAVHAAGTALVIGTAWRLAGEGEHPAPETVALLEEQGVPDPERAFSETARELRGAR
jgi:hypothetical protein